MTKEQIKSILSYYERTIQINKGKVKWGDYINEDELIDKYNHLLEMIIEILHFIEESNMDKVNRWLGFIQGVLWMLNDFKLEDLKDHNRSEE